MLNYWSKIVIVVRRHVGHRVKLYFVALIEVKSEWLCVTNRTFNLWGWDKWLICDKHRTSPVTPLLAF